VPGWGPGAPILVERDWAAVRPGYFYAMYELVKYEDPLLLAFMIFTSSTEFAKSQRRWAGCTDELARALRIYYPSPGYNCPVFFGQFRWASQEGPLAFYGHG
jgi:hypothetical protein